MKCLLCEIDIKKAFQRNLVFGQISVIFVSVKKVNSKSNNIVGKVECLKRLIYTYSRGL